MSGKFQENYDVILLHVRVPRPSRLRDTWGDTKMIFTRAILSCNSKFKRQEKIKT